MVGSMGILALLLTTAAAAAEGGDFTWATDDASQVQPAGYLYNTPLETAAGFAPAAGSAQTSGLASAGSNGPASGSGMSFASDLPSSSGDGTTQQNGGNPFREEPLPPAVPPTPPQNSAPQRLPEAPYPGSTPIQDTPMPDYGTGTGATSGTCGPSCNGACDLGGGAGYGYGHPGERSWLGGISYAGWIDQGVTINTSSPRNDSNFPVTFNDESNQYLMDQIYVLLERPVERSSYAWDIGGRADVLFGTDAKFTTARGLETRHDFSDRWNFDRYGLAIPQLYMEVNAPFGNGLSMKLGHFYTLLGYEKVPAVENFFYSHSYAMQYGEPFTHTGFIGSMQFGSVSYHAGMTRGWNNWEDNNNDYGVLGAVEWTSLDQRTSLSYAIHTGPEQDEPPTNANNNRIVSSLVLQHQIDSRMRYVIQYDDGFERAGADRGRSNAHWYGVNQYLFYAVNCNWELGTRFEWFRDADGTRVTTAQGADYFELTSGLNWRPSDRIAVRPEIRWDWVDTPGFHPFVDGRKQNQLLVDCDVIVSF